MKARYAVKLLLLAVASTAMTYSIVNAENGTGEERALSGFDVTQDEVAGGFFEESENDTGAEGDRRLQEIEGQNDTRDEDEHRVLTEVEEDGQNDTGDDGDRRFLAEVDDDGENDTTGDRRLDEDEDEGFGSGSGSGSGSGNGSGSGSGDSERTLTDDNGEDNETGSRRALIAEETDSTSLRAGRSLATTIYYNGYSYRLLDGTDSSAAGVGCQTGYLTIPFGWKVAPNNADSKHIASSYNWGTHCLITNTGQSWGTKLYTPGIDCWFNKASPVHQVNGQGQWKATSCQRRVLLVKDITGTQEVHYSGNTYRVLDGTKSGVKSVGCQNSYLSIPSGWKVAPNDAASKYVASHYHWGTHCLITNSGQSWGTLAYTAGIDCWFDKTSPVHAVNGNGQWRATSCQRRVLLIKTKIVVNPGTVEVAYGGNTYRVLDGTKSGITQVGCQNYYLSIPRGWKVAPNDAASKHVASHFHWGTHCLITNTGQSWGTLAYTAGIDCWFDKTSPVHQVNGQGQWKATSCQRRVLLIKNKVVISSIDNGDGTVSYKRSLYQMLDRTSPSSTKVGCQTKFIKLPKGWEVASDDADTKNVAADHPWGTHCVIMNNGQSWGTSQYGPFNDCWFDKTSPVHKVKGAKKNRWKATSCQRRILLVKNCSLHTKRGKCNRDKQCHWVSGSCLADY